MRTSCSSPSQHSQRPIAGAVAAVILLLSPLSWGSEEASGASFDCAKASTRIEKMICADGETSDLDGQLARAYRTALSNAESAESVKAEQRAWLASQRNKCHDLPCLKQAYRKRLEALAAPAAAKPTPAPASAPAATRSVSVKKVKFPGGETTIETSGDDEKVIVRDSRSQVMAESTCNAGDFDTYSALFASLKDAIGRNDRSAVVKLMAYPLRVNGNQAKARIWRNQE